MPERKLTWRELIAAAAFFACLWGAMWVYALLETSAHAVRTRDEALRRVAGNDITIPEHWKAVTVTVDEYSHEPIGVKEWRYGTRAENPLGFSLAIALLVALVLVAISIVIIGDALDRLAGSAKPRAP